MVTDLSRAVAGAGPIGDATVVRHADDADVNLAKLLGVREAEERRDPAIAWPQLRIREFRVTLNLFDHAEDHTSRAVTGSQRRTRRIRPGTVLDPLEASALPETRSTRRPSVEPACAARIERLDFGSRGLAYRAGGIVAGPLLSRDASKAI